MPILEKLQFTESELTDGNNHYLLRQPFLKEVWLSDKKHYLLKTKEINEALKKPKEEVDFIKKLGGPAAPKK